MPMVGIFESHTRRKGSEGKKMNGLLENVLEQRFGPQTVSSADAVVEHRWNIDDECRECILYKTLSWNDRLRRKYGVLEELYGDSRGGFILGDSLRLSLLEEPSVFGLYQIEELQSRPEVRRANKLDPQICFFMDSANVWFYGLRNGELFVYDSGTEELDTLGPVKPAIQHLVDEFEDATRA